MVPTLMVTAAFPILARSARDDAGRFDYALGRVLDVSILTGVWFALVLGLGAGLAIQIIGGAKFAPAAEILRIQAVGLGMSFVAVVWSTALLSLRRHREIMRLNLTAMVAGSATTLAMTLVDGARGAALSLVATEFLLAVGGAWLYVRTTGSALPTLRVLPRAVAAGTVAAAAALASNLPTVPSLIVVTVIYVLGLVVSRAVPREIAEALLQQFRVRA
jgi:O-antigen/teichoic acid export membrane protein